MSQFLRLRLPLIAIALLLLAVGYWNIRPEHFLAGDEESISSDVQPEIDFYVENSTTVQYLPDGTLRYQLTSPHMKHVRASGESILEKPYMLLYRGNQKPWQISSNAAEVNAKGTRVNLIDNVRVASMDTRNRPVILTSSLLTVYPDKDYAETRRPVRIEAANGITTATGLQAYLKESRMILQSSVRGQHEVR